MQDFADLTGADTEEMLDLLYEMTSSDKQVAKKDRAKQKAPLKDILHYLEVQH